MIDLASIHTGQSLLHGPSGQRVTVVNVLVIDCIGNAPCARVRFLRGGEQVIELRCLSKIEEAKA